ncbi:adenylate cyclase [Cycloclasticus sp. 46_83_sub15_T18]|nr:adenylate cyclase [Cycloclasticus sp. 46_83_sub15_T18]
MAVEIERKFLVDFSNIVLPGNGVLIKQGYLPLASETKTVVRVRIKAERAYLTVKGANVGASRAEFEYQIPLADAEEMLANLCDKPLVEKTRYELMVEGHCWELDVFVGDNEGLVVAEVELAAETESFVLPSWVEKEVTGDPRYYNSSLLALPYKLWVKA